MRVFLFLNLVVIALGAYTPTFLITEYETPSQTERAETNCLESNCVPILDCLINDGEIYDSSMCDDPDDVYCCYLVLPSTEPSSSHVSSFTTEKLMSLLASSFFPEESTSSSSSKGSFLELTKQFTTDLESTPSFSAVSSESTSSGSSSSSVSTTSLLTSTLSEETTSVPFFEKSTVIDKIMAEVQSTLRCKSSSIATTIASSTSLFEESTSEKTTLETVEVTTDESSTPLTESGTSKILPIVYEAYENDCKIWVCLLKDECNEHKSSEVINMDNCPEPYTKCCFLNYD